MSMAPGARVGPYQVGDLLGVGGMGEVYRARDTKLHRSVALTILPDLFTGDPERLARAAGVAQPQQHRADLRQRGGTGLCAAADLDRAELGRAVAAPLTRYFAAVCVLRLRRTVT